MNSGGGDWNELDFIVDDDVFFRCELVQDQIYVLFTRPSRPSGTDFTAVVGAEEMTVIAFRNY